MRYNQQHINFLLDKSEYYDFELATDNTATLGDYLYDVDLVIDINVCSGLTSNIRWVSGTTESFDLDFISTTGLDNFFISADGAYSGGTVNTGTTEHFTDNEYFKFHSVSGWTTNLSYEIIPETSCLSKLNGGFYQGFFKLFGYPYEMMPARVRKGWTVDMIIKYPNEKTGTGSTLNDVFPDNEGFIFYIGTRSEDKYWNGFTTGTPSEESVLLNWSGLTITDERYMNFYYPSTNNTTGMVDMNHYNPSDTAGVQDYLFYHTYNTGYGMDTMSDDGNVYGGFTIGYAYGGGTSISTGTLTPYGVSPLYTHGNAFVTSGGTSYDGYYHYTNHQPYASRYYDDNTTPLYVKYPFRSITDNAFGIRIREDGHIGYRVLRVGNVCQTGTTVTVENGVTGTTTTNYKIEEAYSTNSIWSAENTGYTNVVIVFERYIEMNDCQLFYDDYRLGTLKIYVNGRPVFKQDNFEEIVPHSLDRQKELQNGVPFNISWGGGTQGLFESVTYGGIDTADRNLMLQQLFAGTWMGSLQSFRMHIRPLDFTQIQHNFQIRQNEYNMAGDFGGRHIFITKN